MNKIQNQDHIKITSAHLKNLSGQISKLQYSNLRRFLWILIAMFISAIASRYFIVFVNLFSAGLTGVSQGITYTVVAELNLEESQALLLKNVGYYIVNLCLNTFVFWFTIKKFGKQFALWSLSAFMISIGFAFFLSYTPGFNSAGFIPNFVPQYRYDDALTEQQNTVTIGLTFAVTAIAATIGGILSGMSTGILLKIGLSGLGMDPIGKYLAKEKGISIGKAMFIFSLCNSMFWIILQDSLSGDINSWPTLIATIFSPRFLGTIIFLTINSFTLSKIYPQGKKLVVEVNTNKGKEVSALLNAMEWHRPHTISSKSGGKTGLTRDIIEMVIVTEEIHEYVNLVSTIDNNAFVIVYTTYGVYGRFESTKRYSDTKKNKTSTAIKDIMPTINNVTDVKEVPKETQIAIPKVELKETFVETFIDSPNATLKETTKETLIETLQEAAKVAAKQEEKVAAKVEAKETAKEHAKIVAKVQAQIATDSEVKIEEPKREDKVVKPATKAKTKKIIKKKTPVKPKVVTKKPATTKIKTKKK